MNELDIEISKRFPHLSEIDRLEISLLVLEREKKTIHECWKLSHPKEKEDEIDIEYVRWNS